jgi:hypothetical protein
MLESEIDIIKYIQIHTKAVFVFKSEFEKQRKE